MFLKRYTRVPKENTQLVVKLVMADTWMIFSCLDIPTRAIPPSDVVNSLSVVVKFDIMVSSQESLAADMDVDIIHELFAPVGAIPLEVAVGREVCVMVLVEMSSVVFVLRRCILYFAV